MSIGHPREAFVTEYHVQQLLVEQCIQKNTTMWISFTQEAFVTESHAEQPLVVNNKQRIRTLRKNPDTYTPTLFVRSK